MIKKKPTEGHVYVLRIFKRDRTTYDVVIPVFDDKGAHRQWKSLVTGSINTAWEEDHYSELPTNWVSIDLEPFS